MNTPPHAPFSDYIVYVDESGDHGLENIDSNYPVFVLVFCVFTKRDYINVVIPHLMNLKMRFWGHTETVLHEHDIRKPPTGSDFAILFDPAVRQPFMQTINRLIESLPFTIIASVIDKNRLREQYTIPANPYQISLSFGLERVFRHLSEVRQEQQNTALVVEKRGRKEDEQLELAFRRICDGSNYLNKPMPFDLVMLDKRANSAGLQIADLIARPIGLRILRPHQSNRAHDIIQTKFRKSASGNVEGWGLKLFP